MTSSKITLRKLDAPPLKGATSREEYQLHKLALQWSQSEPIVIHDESDMKSKAGWKDRLEPFEHQVQNLITYCRRLPVSIIADDVGLGKTVSAGLILSELMVRQRVNRCLVVCTSLIGPQWVEEMQSKFGIEGRFQSGRSVMSAFDADYPVVATTYDSARRYMKEASQAGFDMLILDEAHKLRNLYGAPSQPKMAKRVREVLEDRVFKYVLMLTATPMQNRVWDLYSLIDCLAVAKGHENPLGNPDTFRARFASQLKDAGWAETADGREFREILRQYLVRTRRTTVRLAFPRRELQLRKATATRHDKRLMEISARVVSGFYKGSGLISSSLGVAMMSSPHALRKQLYNMSEKQPGLRKYADQVDAVIREYETPSKLDALLRICNELQAARPDTWRLVVFTCRIETQHVIVRRMAKAGISVGVIKGGAPHENQKTIANYSKAKPDVHVIVSTDSGAEGVNLQAGNVLVNYDLPWNPMILEQRIGRVQRLGSKFRNVVIFNLAVAGTTEDRIVAKLAHKLAEISESVGDIESILEAAGGKQNDSLEDQIREMVTRSLKGQDVEEQRMLAEQSIVNAKKQLREHEHEIDSQLGDLEDLHTAGVRPPDLKVTPPERSLRDFVLMALQEEGAAVQDRGDLGADVAAITHLRENSSTLATFDRETWRQLRKNSVHGFRRIDLYQPGQQAFERLVQRWLPRAQSFVVNRTADDQALAEGAAASWAEKCKGAVVRNVRIIQTTSHFDGTIDASCLASNGVDRYEKLASCRIAHEEHRLPEDLHRQDGLAVADWSVSPQARSQLRKSVEADSDLSAFTSFYSGRLNEELPRVGDSKVRRKKVLDDFSVQHQAEIVGARGVKYSVCHCHVDLAIDGNENYSCKLTLVPLSGHVLNEPVEWARCEAVKAPYPVEFLAKCDFSGRRVLKHLLVKSEESGRSALIEYTDVCPRTGRRALEDEFAESSCSAQRAVRSEFTESTVSERLYLREELSRCEFTHVVLGADETALSELSERCYRLDQEAACTFSNRKGHQSEFIACAKSGRLLSHDSPQASDVSGIRVHPDLLTASERPPHRKGLKDEVAECEQSGKTLLIDEVETCSFTGKVVDDSLLTPCEESQKPVLTAFLERCSETGQLVSPSLLVECSVTGQCLLRRLCGESAVSAKIAKTELLERCEVTDVLALPSELRTSELSGCKFRADEAATCCVSSKSGHRSEFVRCSVSREWVGQDVAAKSDVSGRSGDPRLLTKSDRPPHRRGFEPEVRACDVTSRILLTDEVGRCEITGQVVDTELLEACEETGIIALNSELQECESTGKRVSPSLLAKCTITGNLVLRRLGGVSEVSGNFAMSEQLAACEITNAAVLPDELTLSDISNRHFRSDQSEMSDASGRVAHESETGRCEYTDRLLLLDELGTSDFSGKKTAKSDLIASAVSNRMGRPEETAKCEVTQRVLLKDEVATSAASGLTADRSLLHHSSVSGRLALATELMQCEESGNALLLDESEVCSVTGKRVDLRLLVTSEFSALRALPDAMVTCAVCGRRGVPSDGRTSEETNEWISHDHLVECSVSGQTVRADQCVECTSSGRKLLRSSARRSFKSDRWLHPAEAVRCYWNLRWLAPDESAFCERTQLSYDKDLVLNGEFQHFRELLRRNHKGDDGRQFLARFKRFPALKRTSSVHILRVSPKSRILFVRLHVETKFRMSVFDVGLVARIEKDGELKILSPMTTQNKKTGGWDRLDA